MNNPVMEDTGGRIIESIKAGKLKQAIKFLLTYAKEGDYDIYEEAILLSMRFHDLEAAIIRAAVSWEEEKRERVKIARSVLRIQSCLSNDFPALTPQKIDPV